MKVLDAITRKLDKGAPLTEAECAWVADVLTMTRDTRRRQRDFFASRDRFVLDSARALEKGLDERLAMTEVAPGLFDGEDEE